MPKLDPNSNDFRAAGHKLIDWIGNYFDHIDDFDVLARVQPGDVAKLFAAEARERGASYDTLLQEFEQKLLPGVTHWNHPAFFAYFAITGSQAGVLGELLSAALNLNGMLWRTSPALTELETVALGWLRDALGLPGNLFGIINDTASINTFLGLAAARQTAAPDVRTRGLTKTLRVYCSEHAHNSIDKAAVALGIGVDNVVHIASDERFRMLPEALEEAIAKDRAAGFTPCAIVVTLGTTSTGSVDPLPAVGKIAKRENIWLHVDAAYAGPVTLCEEFRWLWEGIDNADSIVTNPHKWMFTPVDCSVLYTKRPDVLREAFSLVPPAYLTTSDGAAVNYMDYGIQLGRRFRALKLWMVLEHYGLEHLREVLRGHVVLAEQLSEELERRDGVQLMAPQMFGVVVFALKAGDAATEALLQRINASGEAFVSNTKLQGRYCVRVAIGNGATEWKHVAKILELVDARE